MLFSKAQTAMRYIYIYFLNIHNDVIIPYGGYKSYQVDFQIIVK